MTLLFLLLLKSLIVFAASGLVLVCLRRASAAARHLVCLLTLIALLALPLFSLTLPDWHLSVLSSTDSLPAPLLQAAAEKAPPAPNNGGVGAETEAGAAGSAPTGSSPSPPLLGAEGTPSPIHWPLLLLSFYLFGVALASLRPLLGLWGVSRLHRLCRTIDDAETLAAAFQCAALLHLKTPRVCRADVGVPMTWGWHRPVVLLPESSVGWPEDRLQSVLLHEMAHIKRRDWTCHRLADFVCALYWFHPLAWMTARHLRSESELACDDLVLASGIPAPEYARHLLDIAHALPPKSQSTQAAIAMAQTSRIEGRLRMILDSTQSRRTLTRRVLLVALVPSAATLMILAALRPDAKGQEMTTAANAPVPAASGVSAIVPVTIAGIADEKQSGGHWSDQAEGPWWDRNGAALSKPVYDTNSYHSNDFSFSSHDKLMLFTFRLPATLRAAGFTYGFAQSTGCSSSSGRWPGKTSDEENWTEARLNTRTNGTRVVTASFPAALTKTNLQVGVASGPWTTLEASQTTTGQSTSIGSRTFIFSPVIDTPKDLVLTIALGGVTDAGRTEDRRIVAVDWKGHEWLPSSINEDSSNSTSQITVHFAMPLKRVKLFRLETRSFQWTEFKDVALQPLQTAAGIRSLPTVAEWQTPWTSSLVRSTWGPAITHYMQMHLAPATSGTHPDPPVAGALVAGPGQASHFSISAWKPGRSNILTAQFDYTPKKTDKIHPDVIHLLTKTGTVAAIIMYYSV